MMVAQKLKTLAQVVAHINREIGARGLARELVVEAVDGAGIKIKQRNGLEVTLPSAIFPLDVLADEALRYIDMVSEKNPLERYRLAHKMSYGKLGEKLGVPQQQAWAWCKNINSPPMQRRFEIKKMANGEVEPDDWPLPPRDAHRPPGSTDRQPRRRKP